MFDDRLRKLRKAKGETQARTAAALNIGESAYSNYEKDLREPNAEVLKAMSRHFGVTIDYLLDCRTGFTATPEEQRKLSRYRALDRNGKRAVDALLDIEYERCTERPEPVRRRELIEIRFTPAPVSAGFGDMLEDDNIWETVKVPFSNESRKADFILRVHGDSMEPRFSDGDYILVRQQPEVDMGQIGVFAHNGEGYVKKFGGDRLISLNRSYEDIMLGEDDRCFGLVLGTTEIVEE